MKIGIDLRTLSEGKTTGVEVYTYNLVRALLDQDSVNDYLLFYSAWKTKPAFTRQELPKNARLVSVKAPNRLLNASMLFLGYPKLDKLLGGLDLFFSPRYLFTALSKECALIVTIHDLSFMHNPSFFSFKQRVWHKIISDKRSARRAKAVIAVSNSTKDDVVRFFNINKNTVKVVYPGLAKDPGEEGGGLDTLKKYGINSEYIFHLATIEPRKNALGVIDAYENLKQNPKYFQKLVIAGGLGWLYNETLKRVKNSPQKENIIILQNIDALDKHQLYRNASLFVFPSYYEGFGFPPLEAMAAGTPVIAGSNSSMKEVLAEAALFVNPYRTDEITLAMSQLLEDNKLREIFVEKGRKRAAEFTWERSARETLEVFEIAASSASADSSRRH